MQGRVAFCFEWGIGVGRVGIGRLVVSRKGEKEGLPLSGFIGLGDPLLVGVCVG